MKIFNLEIKKVNQDSQSTTPDFDVKSSVPNQSSSLKIYGPNYPIVTRNFDGEKTLGELGVVTKSVLDYNALRLRSRDSLLKQDTTKIITDKHVDYTIGTGLKLQAEPEKTILELEGVEVDFIKFQEHVEARFNIYANSKYCDYSEQKTLHQIAYDLYKEVFTSGDALVVCRVGSLGLNIQIFSGEHIKSPIIGDTYFDEAKTRGNYINHGIEFDSKGRHIAYYVHVLDHSEPFGKVERIEVYGKKTKRKMAWMVYGQKLSCDHLRGIPQMTQTLEKNTKLDRYTEAAVGKAEQAAKLLYAIEHDAYSNGEDVLESIKKNKNNIIDTPDGYELGDGLANRIVETTSNQTFNMPVGSKLKSFTTSIETDYEAFERANFNKISASANVPPEVALNMYNSNYSASRAAINGWSYTVDIDRVDFALDFYIPFYKLWLEIEILKGKIDAPGFIVALQNDDFIVIEAYSKCRFIGKNMPHIDPLKEAKSVELMLGLGLISRDQATEMLNLGDWYENYLKLQEENENVIVKPEIQNENENV
jgi:lambda family phage portal protein